MVPLRPSVFLSTQLFALSRSVTDMQRERSNAKQEKEAASELAAVGSMNAGRAFDRDMLRGSIDDALIDNIWFRNEGRSDFSNSLLAS
jgi:hypothetical protein